MTTNVNFNATRFMALIADAVRVRDRAGGLSTGSQSCWPIPKNPHRPSAVRSGQHHIQVVAQAATVGVAADLDQLGPDIVGLRNLNLYGLKGSAPYAHHAHALGYRSDETDAGIEAGLDFLAAGPPMPTRCWATPWNWARST